MKRTICMILTLLAASSAIVSCGDTATTPDSGTTQTGLSGETETTAAQKEATPYEQMEARDFEQAVYTILDANTHKDLHINIPGDSLTGELVNDALLTRDFALADRFNVQIQYVQDENTDKMKKSVQAGDNEFNLVIAELFGLSGCASANVLHNMEDLPYISLSEKWWSPLMHEALTLKDAMYYSASDLAPSIYQSPCCMFLNLKLYQDYDIDTDIYQLVLDGKWTVDALFELTKDMDQDLNNNGKNDIEDDFYGIAMQPTEETACAFLAGAGVSMCKITDDGNNLVLDIIDNAKSQETIEKLKKVCRNIPYKDINDVINITFKSDRALFLQHKLETAAVHLRDMESDYLILPDPKADETQKNYYSFVSGYVSGFVGVPVTAESEMTGFVTEALARYSNAYIRPLAYETVYKQKDTRDPRSADVLDVLFDNLFIDFGAVYNFGSFNNIFSNVFFKDSPLVSSLEKKRASADKAIVKMIENWNPEA